MIVLNFWGGPGSGKSTTAAYVFAYLKNRGVSCELVGEVAKDMIYQGKGHLLTKPGIQRRISTLQFTRLEGMAKAGCKVAIADSPLMMQLVYAQKNNEPRLTSLEKLVTERDKSWPQINIFVRRTKNYDPFGRVQTYDQARQLDIEIAVYMITKEIPINWKSIGDQDGQSAVAVTLYRDLKKRGVV